MRDEGESQTVFQPKDSLAIADRPVVPLLAKKPSLDATSIGFAAHLLGTPATVVWFRFVPCCRFFAGTKGNLRQSKFGVVLLKFSFGVKGVLLRCALLRKLDKSADNVSC